MNILGEYDFTYELPKNFGNRVCQFLAQGSKVNMVSAFKRCRYEYDIIGFAYYAGLRGDNWNKKAVDFTLEGPSKDIEYLKNNNIVFKESIQKALKPSESGFLVRDIYLFPDDNLDDYPETNEDRLNIDLKISKEILSDLIQICGLACSNYDYNGNRSENSINDYFRDMLMSKGYEEVKDQTRHGKSANGKDAGEVDILISKEGKEVAIYEGLKLKFVNKSYISTHIDKAIHNYNSLGTAVFIVSYVDVSDFGAFWQKYSEYIRTYNFNLEEKRNYKELAYPNASTRVSSIILSRDGYDFPVYFIALKIS